ncbi:hypothetical protein N7462_003502 [Penicillium macrosclerotiorum]|uniref:uncharacterized protein n=1 Tax=Penicillium macrosclerotiorum TaxID=303699 RepID=UPI002546AF7D|nr:uncharacterized protein N7462_003502 [Penicillium macrosclerotiorum]KAJ5689110.1 hypothetical protein N7462_003502 [Penicillium macrosclerotiorum]
MHERQRVWRACQPCRRKKIKCDGQSPCQTCSRKQSACVYEEPNSKTGSADPLDVIRLENRIQMMEQTLRLQLTRQQQGENNRTSGAPVGRSAFVLHDGVGSCYTEELQDEQCTGLSEAPLLASQSPSSEGDDGNRVGGSALDGSDTLLGEILDPAAPTPVDVTRLPEPLLQALVDSFYSSYYPIFPIIEQHDFQWEYDRWSSMRQGGDGDASNFSFLLYALLAVAASAIPAEHTVFDQPGLQFYKRVNLGNLLYSHATSNCSGLPFQQDGKNSMNSAIALGLLSLYLIGVGNVSGAWAIAGHAVHLYQGLELEELEDNADGVPDAGETWSPCGNVWWCLYILDCSLSTALSKPLAISDTESDLRYYEEANCPALGLETKTDPWFSVIASFHVTISRIYRSIRWIRKSHRAHNDKMWDILRVCTKRYDDELENYYTKQVLPKMEEPNRQVRPLALQTIAVSSYYIGIVLLYRTSIEHSNAADPEGFLRCAEAAANCIQATPGVIAHVPISHFVIQQSRALYASTKVLLHCMRLAKNVAFNDKAWRDVEAGFDMLCKIDIQWPQIRKYQQLIEGDMQRTQSDFNKHKLFHRLFDRYEQKTAGKRGREHSEGHEGRPNTNMDQDWQSMEYKPTRYKLPRNFVRDESDSTASSALNILRSEEPDGYSVVRQTMNIGDFVPLDLPSLSMSLEDSPSVNLFDDATLTFSIGHIHT